MRELNKNMLNKEKNIVGKKNNPGLAFNPITLEYDKSVQGEVLRNRDDQARVSFVSFFSTEPFSEPTISNYI